MPDRYQYAQCCVDGEAEALTAMMDQATDVTYRTMFRHCIDLLDWAKSHGYETDSRRGLTLRQDWAVSYHRSKFKGLRCYYLRWSGIEFIFLPEGTLGRITREGAYGYGTQEKKTRTTGDGKDATPRLGVAGASGRHGGVCSDRFDLAR
jgi:hypothetical protein